LQAVELTDGVGDGVGVDDIEIVGHGVLLTLGVLVGVIVTLGVADGDTDMDGVGDGLHGTVR
jgi:hypothetical protein